MEDNNTTTEHNMSNTGTEVIALDTTNTETGEVECGFAIVIDADTDLDALFAKFCGDDD